MKWNPRYAAYARAHGRTPEAMLEHDRGAWPGGRMTGFMCWIADRWRAWWERRRTRPGAGRSLDVHVKDDADHVDFDAMLREGT